MQIPTYKRQTVTPQPIDNVEYKPDLSKEQAIGAWGDVVANKVPQAAMAVDDAVQAEHDVKFDLAKDDINSSAREALDGMKDDLNQKDPKDLYLNGDIASFMQDYEARMQKAREKSTGNMKGWMKRRADRYWDSISSVNKDVAKQIYEKAQKEAGAMLVGQKVGEAVAGGNEQAAIDAIDEGVRIGAILPKDRDKEVAEAKKTIFDNQTQSILADRGTVFNNALDMIHTGQITSDEDIDNLFILGIMPERGINTDLRKQLKAELKDQKEKQALIDKGKLDDEVSGVVSSAMDEMKYMNQEERAEFIAQKQIEWQRAYPDRRDKMIDPLSDYDTWIAKAEKTGEENQKKLDSATEQLMLGDARRYITESSPAQGKAYITALIGSLSSDGQKQLNDYYNGYWDARKKDITDKQSDYFNKTIMPAIRNGEITSRQQIESDPNLEDWHEIGVPSFLEKALTLFDNMHDKGTKASSGVSAGTSGELTALLKSVTNPFASDDERLNVLLNFATNPNTWHLTDTDEYKKLYSDVKNHHFPTDARISRLADKGMKRITELRDAGKDKEADELEEAYVNFFHNLADTAWYKVEKDESGNNVERQLSKIERDKLIDSAVLTFDQIIAAKDLTKVFDYTYNANPAKFDVKGDNYEYSLKGNGDYNRIKEKAVDSINVLGNYGRAVNSRTILRNYEQGYMEDAGITGLGDYTYEYQEIVKPVKNPDGSIGKEKTYGMVFVSPDQDTLYYIADNERGDLNIYEAHRAGGTNFTLKTYVPATVKELIDAKKAKKAAQKPFEPKPNIITEMVTNPDINLYEATNAEENVAKMKEIQKKNREEKPVRTWIQNAVRGKK